MKKPDKFPYETEYEKVMEEAIEKMEAVKAPTETFYYYLKDFRSKIDDRISLEAEDLRKD